ncbi:DUF2147 domain-containing protein [Winogradskyella aurantiaca]|uniref:DUF2147 domain-containing protein n=1 Tax=Winogradskyella aurantiaca TaxID=2219558 RepID=UPI000E1E21E3|nr:DUF2147 domain-containing protein [Winogradskyella aurantiaca]
MNKLLVIIAALITVQLSNAQDILGKWRTIDDETGEPKSIVNLYEKDGKLYGDIIEILNPDKVNSVCSKCEGELKDKPIMGMTIINSMVKDDDIYENGTIVNPSTGKTYKCRLKLEEANKLQVRGYVAFFYKTQYWERVK